MDPIPIDLMELGEALEDHTVTWYLDLRKGDVIPLSDDPECNEEGLESNTEVFLPIPPRASREGFAMMENFVEAMPEGEASRSLARALRLPRPFRSFKDTLFDFPEERDSWFKFRSARLREAAIEFLAANEVPWTEGGPLAGGPG